MFGCPLTKTSCGNFDGVWELAENLGGRQKNHLMFQFKGYCLVKECTRYSTRRSILKPQVVYRAGSKCFLVFLREAMIPLFV